uniref:RING-type E3 ubiquitin transferase n=2 Tax=Pyxicephalus adspersus TaxID=30357 RepID=A0AAV3A3J8_PYXAD|nr:TPA: hypothetical protein GDO54_013134 [Pyxicephalus adspersus]
MIRWSQNTAMDEEDAIREMLGSWGLPSLDPPGTPVKDGMRREMRRLVSFRDWPCPGIVSPQQLARAGFFYLGPGDRVQCFCCRGILRSWEPGDQPCTEHRKYFPACPFIQGRDVGNLPLAGATDSVDGQILAQLQRMPEGEEEDWQAVYPELLEERQRLGTFHNWPQYTGVTPEQLARAGFFYTGQRDNVRCFHCDGELRNWERGDDPWREHAKWFPRCEFLVQSMGPAYIRSVQDAIGNSPENLPESLRTSERSPSTQSEPTRIQESPAQRPASQAPKQPETTLSAEEQLRRLKEERMCKVCMDKDVSMVFVPCGHLVVCMDCAPNLRHCPICRATIRGSMRAFMS